MSYDLYLRDPVTKETLEVTGHLMYGGNIPCVEVNGQLVPTTSTEAYLNITYNYAPYYYEAFPGKEDNERQFDADSRDFGITDEQGGIRSLNGITGAEAVRLLRQMILRITDKYKPDGKNWIETERDESYYIRRGNPGTKIDPWTVFKENRLLERDGLSEEQAEREIRRRYERVEKKITVSEGATGDYWQATAANAIKPLYQLIALSQMRPDGVWSEES